jgi:hypothetical protein
MTAAAGTPNCASAATDGLTAARIRGFLAAMNTRPLIGFQYYRAS